MGDFRPLIVGVGNNALENALAAAHIAVVNGVFAKLYEEVIDDIVLFHLFDVLDKV